jgi:diacylglycerol kinase (ATP)
MKPLIILNPYAGAGALRHFDTFKTELSQICNGELWVIVTMSVAEIGSHVKYAAQHGFDTVLALGGDGTNLAVVNALIDMGEQQMTFATLPLGTGRDLARSLETPLEPKAAIAWLKDAVPTPMDVGRVSIDGNARYFLNASSTGISGIIATRVNDTTPKRPWTFMEKTVSTLLQFDAPRMTVEIDGHAWFEGEAFILTVGNGRFFGRGMKAHPQAYLNDGLFDVILIEEIPRAEALVALPQLMNGTHLGRTDVQFTRGSQVKVTAFGKTLDMETDGEPAQGKEIIYSLLPKAINILVHPSSEAFRK